MSNFGIVFLSPVDSKSELDSRAKCSYVDFCSKQSGSIVSSLAGSLHVDFAFSKLPGKVELDIRCTSETCFFKYKFLLCGNLTSSRDSQGSQLSVPPNIGKVAPAAVCPLGVLGDRGRILTSGTGVRPTMHVSLLISLYSFTSGRFCDDFADCMRSGIRGFGGTDTKGICKSSSRRLPPSLQQDL